MPTDELEILDVPIPLLTVGEALARVAALYERPDPALVVYVNAHTLNLATKDSAYRDVLRRSALVLNDGIGLALAARINRRRFPANLNGSDLNPQILELAAERGWSVFFLGARPGVADRAVTRLRERIGTLRVAGTRSGYFAPEESAAVAEAIRATGADVVMVAMGNPLQEMWLAEHLAATGARIGVGVGAFFDFAAGEVRRAPRWMNRAGVEWVYRLWQEPRRMWRRYVVGNPLFLARVIRDRVARGRGAS